MRLLFDEEADDPDAPVVPENMKSAGCLIVGPRARQEFNAAGECTYDQLAEWEAGYRRNGRPPVLFIDQAADAGSPTLGNPGQMAAAMGRSPVGLTIEMAEAWLLEQWRTTEAR